jgi:predicted Zn finger-like uncharacterized protein
MSLITRCPACGTMFKVVPDQLRISEGWVRCGHCAEIFDATTQLKNEPELSAPVPSVTLETRTALIRDSSPEREAIVSPLSTDAGERPSAKTRNAPLLETQVQAPVQHTPDTAAKFPRRGKAKKFPAPQVESELEPDLHDVSFVRKARRRGVWARSGVRAVLWIALFGLGALLALQIAVHDRDRLAATIPVLRPWLVKLCEPLDCRIGPPRQIDMLAIDSSSFNKLRGDSYRLAFTLKNQATIQLAMPALELTLTDGQDQPLVRRVLMPAELGPNPGVIAATSEWSGSIALAVAANGIGAPIAGYRLLVFYP